MLEARGLTTHQMVTLQLIRQNKVEDLSKAIEDHIGLDLQYYEDAGLISYVKAKNKSQNKFELIRATSKANALLDDLETPQVEDEDLKVYAWLSQVYLSKGKELGNQKQGKKLLALFRLNSGIAKNALTQLCVDYLNDEEAQRWSIRLDYVFFKAPDIHRTKFDIEESKLWKFYLKRKSYYDELFKSDKYQR